MSILSDWKKGIFPPDWNIIFGNSKKIVLDIGCGNGDFLINISRDKNYNYVGIELSEEFLMKAQRKIERLKIANVRLIKADAFFVLPCLFTHSSIARVHVNFPDPWEKKRHKKKRLFSKEFIKILSSRLERNGKVFLLTDHKEFKDFVIENFNDFRGIWKIEMKNKIPSDYPYSRYRRKWEEMGRSIYFLEFTLLENGEDYRCPLRVLKNIKNVEIKKSTDIKNLVPRIKDIIIKEEDRVIHVEKVYIEESGRELLLKITIKEFNLLQKLFISIYSTNKKTIITLLNPDELLFTEGIERTLLMIKNIVI